MIDAREVVQSVRPLRVCFVVDDRDSFEDAIELASISWGGVFSGLVYAPQGLDEYSRSVVAEFDGDVIVDFTERCGEALIAASPARYLRATDFAPQWPLRIHRVVHGMQLHEVLNHCEGYRGRTPLTYEAPARYLFEDDDPHALLFLTLFGRATERIDNYDEMTLQVAVGVHPVAVNEENFMKLPSADVAPSLLEWTAFGCNPTIRGSFGTNVIVVGTEDSLEDLSLFWNLRATGRRAVFLPSSDGAVRERVISALRMSWEDHLEDSVPSVVYGPSLSEDEKVEETKRIIQLELPFPITSFNYSRPVWGFDEAFMSDVRVLPVSAGERRDVAIFGVDSSSPLLSLTPPFIDRIDYTGPFRWMIDVEVVTVPRRDQSVTPPASAAGDEIVLQRLHARGSKGKLSVHSTRSFSVPVFASRQIGESVLRDAGYRAHASVPGSYAERIVETLGGYTATAILRTASTRAVLESVRNGRCASWKEVFGTAARSWRAEDAKILGLGTDATATTGAQATLTAMIERRILRLGLLLRCGTCTREDWYGLDEFGTRFKCRHCFANHTVGRVDRLEWHYRADGVFDVRNDAEGALNSILTMTWFTNVTNLIDPKFISSTNVEHVDSGKRAEIDFMIVAESSIEGPSQRIIGESRRYYEYTDAEIEKARNIAQRVGGWLCVSTLNQTFSPDERASIIDTCIKGVRVIPVASVDLHATDFGEHLRAQGLHSGGTLSQLADALLKEHVGKNFAELRWS